MHTLTHTYKHTIKLLCTTLDKITKPIKTETVQGFDRD